MQPDSSVSLLACQAGMAPSRLFAWKRRALEGGQAAIQADENVVGASRVRDLEKQVRGLERLLGRKAMEAEILKEALELARQKNDIAATVVARSGERLAVEAVTGALVCRAPACSRGRSWPGATPSEAWRGGPRRSAAYDGLAVKKRPTHGYQYSCLCDHGPPPCSERTDKGGEIGEADACSPGNVREGSTAIQSAAAIPG